MTDTIDAVKELQMAIAQQNEINVQLALAEREKTIELQKQTGEIEKQRVARESHTRILEQLVKSITELITILNILLSKKHFENIEQFLEILLPILSQVSTTLALRKTELERLERLIVNTRRQDVNVSGTNIGKYDNYGKTQISESDDI